MKKVLVCDDDEDILDVITIILEGKGYNVFALNKADKVYKAVDDFKPDVILLDLGMPGVTGETITKELKKKNTTKIIPIIIISANQDTVKIAEELGADDFLCKPFDIGQLEKIVDKYAPA